MAIPDSLRRSIERLPRGIELYDRDPANTASNVRNLLAAQAQEDDAIWEFLRSVKRSRYFDEAKLMPDWVLELLVRWVGTVRQTGWDNDRLLAEFDMDVFLQESWGNFEQIKTLFAHWFASRFPQSHVLTPEDKITFVQQVGGEKLVPALTHTGKRVVTETDIFIIANRRPMQPTSAVPLSYPYLFEKSKPHTRYGIFDKLHFVMVPWTAIPKIQRNTFMGRLAPLAGGVKQFNTVASEFHTPGFGLVGVGRETLDVQAMLAATERYSQAQIKNIIWGYGGFVPLAAPVDANGVKQFNTVSNSHHGVSMGPVPGDVQMFLDAEAVWGSQLWDTKPLA